MDNISYNTKKSLLLEKIGKIIVCAAAGITIGLLFWIIGYIIFKGIVSDTKKEYGIVGEGRVKASLDEKGEYTVVFIVHTDIRTEELDMNTIIDFFTGEERFWLVSEQGLKVRPFSLSPSQPPGRIFRDTVIGEHEEFVRSTVFVDSDAEMIRMVSSTIGGIGYIGTNSVSALKKARAVRVRTLSLVVNSEVLSIKNNIKLNFLTEEHVRLIFTSKVRNWREVGGIDLPIMPYAYSEDTYLGRMFIENVLMKNPYGETVHPVSSNNELVDVVNSHPGAIGFSPYLLLKKDYPGQIVNVERREIKPNISLHFLLEDPEKAGKAGGIASIIINTMLMVLLTLLIATPLGVGAALYLTEYARQGKLISILRFFTETLAGIPSIIFGLFGYIVFVIILRWGMGLLSGTLTITIMVLPTIIRTAEEAFKAVPKSYREESLALGATLWQTIRGVVIPAAIPGIITGIILAIGRTVGETAAVLFTLGSRPGLFQDIFSSGRVLSLHLYILAKEGISFERAFATALIIVIIILIVNLSTASLIGRMAGLKKR